MTPLFEPQRILLYLPRCSYSRRGSRTRCHSRYCNFRPGVPVLLGTLTMSSRFRLFRVSSSEWSLQWPIFEVHHRGMMAALLGRWLKRQTSVCRGREVETELDGTSAKSITVIGGMGVCVCVRERVLA